MKERAHTETLTLRPPGFPLPSQGLAAMQRKPAPGFPTNSCSIRMPDSIVGLGASGLEEVEGDLQQHRRQQLINFAHSHWGFNNWSWAVTKQELDFVDFSSGKYSVGVVAFVSVTVRSLDISREDIGYATVQAPMKGSAIFQARKCAVTNALRETLLSFGGNIGTDLIELLESQKVDVGKQVPELTHENNQNVANKVDIQVEPKNSNTLHNRNPNIRKDSSDSGGSREAPTLRSPHKTTLPHPPAKPAPVTVPIAKAQPMPANQVPPQLTKPAFPANQMPPKPHPPPPPTTAPLAHVRPNSNETGAPPEAPHVSPPHSMTEEDLRAERKRRQKQAQEEFRIKQLQKQSAQPHIDGDTNSDTVDNLIMDMHTQELMEAPGSNSKRKSDESLPTSKRPMTKLDIVQS